VTRPGPRVSVGLPVYNGERYLGELLDCLVAQTFEDFEVIISDNASTDGTERICRARAAADPRISYVRQQVNRGAAVNHNLVLERARGEYFKWMAYDDRYEPEYLAECVAALDADHGAVLAHTDTVVIDLDGKVLEIVSPGDIASSPRAADRFRDIVLVDEQHRVYEMYGLMRTGAVRATGGFKAYEASDFPFIAEIALRGRFARVPKPLFANRVTPEARYPEGHPNYDPTAGGGKLGARFFHARMAFEFAKLVATFPMPPADKVRCFAALGNDLPRKARNLAGDLAGNARALLERR
jgi:glycosyltransferase involved in cell wall biosynthesis